MIHNHRLLSECGVQPFDFLVRQNPTILSKPQRSTSGRSMLSFEGLLLRSIEDSMSPYKPNKPVYVRDESIVEEVGSDKMRKAVSRDIMSEQSCVMSFKRIVCVTRMQLSKKGPKDRPCK
jgi:hypothetical protein